MDAKHCLLAVGWLLSFTALAACTSNNKAASGTGGHAGGTAGTSGIGGQGGTTGGSKDAGIDGPVSGDAVFADSGGDSAATDSGVGTGGTTDGGGGGAAGDVGGSYLLPPDRATAWNLAGLLSKGGIPSAGWPLCNFTPLLPSGGDDTIPINAAIAGCAAGGVVMLGPGTFTIGKGNYIALDKGVVLRGSGAGVTILKNPLNLPATSASQSAADSTPIVIVGRQRWVGPDGDGRCQGPTAYNPAYMQLLSADGSKGSTSVTVTNGAIFSAGQIVLLDETSGAGWQADVVHISTSVWASPDYAVEWQLHNPGSGIDDPIQAGTTPSAANNYAGSGNGSDAACWFSRDDRPQNEIKEIASVSGNSITFTSPLHKSYHTSQHAELTTYTSGNLHVRNAGIEELSVVGGGDGAVRFEDAAYAWAKNVEVTTWYGEGFAIDNCFRVEVRDSYVHDAAWAEPGGAGYAISLAGASSELLIENNISIKANKVMVARSSGSGSVVGYNYMDDGYIATTEGWIEIGLNASHMVGSHHVLFEGNQSFNMDSDDTHGNSTYHTYFRNYVTTVRAKFQSDFTGNSVDDVTSSGNGPKRAAGAMIYSYFMSFVGNVLGQSALTTAANGYADSATNMSNAIWLLGWNATSPYTADAKVASTAVRDGNWDWFLGRQTWLTSSAATLPDSLYLPGKPAFFGANVWPWVDPSTGATHTLPAKARFDAGTPNLVP